MEWQNPHQEPWKSLDPNASWPQGSNPRGPEMREVKGNVLLGIFSGGKYVRQYTDPDVAAKIDRRLQAQRARMAQNPLSGSRSTGLELPRQFTVGMGKGRKAAITVWAVFVFVLLAAMLVLGSALAMDGDTESLTVTLVLAVVLGAAVVYAMLAVKKRIDVDGSCLLVNGQTFGAWDIAGVSMSAFNGTVKLYGHDGRKLAQFYSNMKNAPLMMQWLKEHNTPLRG